MIDRHLAHCGPCDPWGTGRGWRTRDGDERESYLSLPARQTYPALMLAAIFACRTKGSTCRELAKGILASSKSSLIALTFSIGKARRFAALSIVAIFMSTIASFMALALVHSVRPIVPSSLALSSSDALETAQVAAGRSRSVAIVVMAGLVMRELAHGTRSIVLLHPDVRWDSSGKGTLVSAITLAIGSSSPSMIIVSHASMTLMIAMLTVLVTLLIVGSRGIWLIITGKTSGYQSNCPRSASVSG